MNKPAPTAMRNQAQGGFTLIELIVVIVILGILAATALPRFSNLGSSARIASLNAARGAIGATVAMVHGQALLNPALAVVTNEGQQVNIVNLYPAGNANTAAAAGLTNADYAIIEGPAQATANAPLVAAGSVLIQPLSVSTTPDGLACNLLYTQAANANTPPTVVLNTANCGQ